MSGKECGVLLGGNNRLLIFKKYEVIDLGALQ